MADKLFGKFLRSNTGTDDYQLRTSDISSRIEAIPSALVSLGIEEYDIHFAYTNPCDLFERNIRNNLKENQSISADDERQLKAYYANCNALFLTEWETKLEQLLEVDLPTHARDVITEPVIGPYRERTARRKRDMCP
jgi:hypothetical protein